MIIMDTPYIPYDSEQPWLPCSEALFDWDESFHQLMLNDRIRMASYEKAIKETVKPGDVVIDLGTGTGVLSLWALEAGASRVYGIDMDSDMLQVACNNIAQKGFAKHFVPLNQLSFLVHLPEKADVLISEIMGNILDNEDFQPILADAITRLLKPQGKKIPLQASSYIVPVAAKQAHHSVCQSQVATINDNYNLSKILKNKGITEPCNMYYDTIIPHSLYLSSAQQLREYKNDWSQSPTYNHTLTFDVKKDGSLTGFKAYFIAQLSQYTTLDISGDNIIERETSDSWKHAYLPIASPISVKAGDTINISFTRFYQENHNLENKQLHQAYQWKGQVIRNNTVQGTFFQSMEDRRLLPVTA